MPSLRPPLQLILRQRQWPRMSAHWRLNNIDREYADKLGYARLASVPPEVLAQWHGHRPGADRLWREITGVRCELANKRLFENSGGTVEWYEYEPDHEKVKQQKRRPDLVYARIPIQTKGSPDYRNFYVRKDQIFPEQIYIHVCAREFPHCEIMGWVLGKWLNDYGKDRNDGAPGKFLDHTHLVIRDVMELIWHPQRILQEIAREVPRVA